LEGPVFGLACFVVFPELFTGLPALVGLVEPIGEGDGKIDGVFEFFLEEGNPYTPSPGVSGRDGEVRRDPLGSSPAVSFLLRNGLRSRILYVGRYSVLKG